MVPNGMADKHHTLKKKERWYQIRLKWTKRPSYPGIHPVIYQPTAFLSSCAFKRNQQAFLHSSLPTDNVPAIVQGKCRVQRMSDLFAEQWALTLALQQFFSFGTNLYFY